MPARSSCASSLSIVLMRNSSTAISNFSRPLSRRRLQEHPCASRTRYKAYRFEWPVSVSADSKMHGGTPPNASANLVSSRLLIYFGHVQLDVESGRSSAKQPADRECFFL